MAHGHWLMACTLGVMQCSRAMDLRQCRDGMVPCPIPAFRGQCERSLCNPLKQPEPPLQIESLQKLSDTIKGCQKTTNDLETMVHCLRRQHECVHDAGTPCSTSGVSGFNNGWWWRLDITMRLCGSKAGPTVQTRQTTQRPRWNLS